MERIRPPRLEDAGLEECALAPNLIEEAFRRAANAVRPILSPSHINHCEDSLSFPPEESSDVQSAKNTPCKAVNRGFLEALGDEVASGATDLTKIEGKIEKIAEHDIGNYVDVFHGLGIEEFEKADDEGEDDERPTLAENHI